MSENQSGRVHHRFTPEERARWEKARDDALALRPALVEKGRRLREASSEATFSGALRAAIHRHAKPLPVIASECGMALTQLDEFLLGDRTLRSDAIDRLIQVLDVRFPLEHLTSPPKVMLPDWQLPGEPILDPGSAGTPRTTG